MRTISILVLVAMMAMVGCDEPRQQARPRMRRVREVNPYVQQEVQRARNRRVPTRPTLPVYQPAPVCRPGQPCWPTTQQPTCRPGQPCWQNSTTLFQTLPPDLRVHNWTTARGGSCVIASLAMVANKQGRESVAIQLQRSAGGAQSSSSLRAVLDRLNLQYTYTEVGDVAFLNWVSRTNRGATVTFGYRHVVFFGGWETINGKQFAVIVDNNRTDREQFIPADQFVAEWRKAGGWATTLTYPNGGLMWPIIDA